MDYPVPGFRPLNQESSPRPLDQDLAQDLRRPLTYTYLQHLRQIRMMILVEIHYGENSLEALNNIASK